MKKLIVLLIIVSLVSVASAVRYPISGDWMDPATWGGSIPGASDTVRITYGSTIWLAATAPDILGLQIGVDESGTLLINNGGSLTVLDSSTVGNNGACTGTLEVNAGGTLTNNGWFKVGAAAIGDMTVGGTVNMTGHLWVACAVGSSGTTIDINDGGVINVGGMIGVGTINAVDPSGSTATLNINEGGLLALSDIHPAGTSIQPGSMFDITGNGMVTLPGDFEAVIAVYAAAGKIAGNGIPGNIATNLTTNPGFTTVFAVLEPVCISPPTMDTNDDCRIDLIDLAVFVSEWLTCGLDYQSLCW